MPSSPNPPQTEWRSQLHQIIFEAETPAWQIV